MAEQMSIENELARVIDPDAYDEEMPAADRPVAQAEAWLYASRVARWLVEHDRDVGERAVAGYQLQVGKVLLGLLPTNPYKVPKE